ncbi:MAG TPA: bifunctional phosphopantothenoylcysteine decarboxylase/phosphopantothenate--cysteine ligase CoaBC [Pyrinomonadaceae bacterium]|jgi:phosphopantothenoylcysteine decarboxylase/phosphopantothenate--cysteine ligase|nr:bifunctional phosphopantothenoylcysteine decarboxylase/phosphopantothenate--cysteine ligase CoaBC [Pyrinomonadaceae bacterium]
MTTQAEMGQRVALGISGGIAAYKAAEVLRGLQRAGCSVRVAMTERACEFITPLTFRALSGSHVIVDDYAPDNPDPIAHITFSQTVDLFLIAPATANIIAKLAHGVADDFLTSTYLACNAPVLIAPAMNTTMWNHPATQRNLKQLRADGVRVVEPDSGEMACGTIGPGRLSDPELIVAAALDILRERARDTTQDLKGERILITTGATREQIDPVRFLSNNSSGRMGFALAEAARARGASVTVVAGATTAQPPAQDVKLLRALSAEEMLNAVMKEVEDATIFIAAAAVSDYRPTEPAAQKIKKSVAQLTLTLEPTPDILASVAASKRDGLLVVGFAAETFDVLAQARAKLERKRLDAIIANDVTRAGAGFDTETNIVTILTRGNAVELPLMSKREAAHRILDQIARLRLNVVSAQRENLENAQNETESLSEAARIPQLARNVK